MISSIPQLQTNDRVIGQLQQNIIQPINELLKNPIVQGVLLTGISLSSGTNVIPTTLGRAAQGWALVDLDADISIYRSAPLNAQTLTLTASGTATVNIYIF